MADDKNNESEAKRRVNASKHATRKNLIQLRESGELAKQAAELKAKGFPSTECSNSAFKAYFRADLNNLNKFTEDEKDAIIATHLEFLQEFEDARESKEKSEKGKEDGKKA